MAVVVDEYDPMRPNDYEECKQKQREKEQQEREAERSKRDRDYDDRYSSSNWNLFRCWKLIIWTAVICKKIVNGEWRFDDLSGGQL